MITVQLNMNWRFMKIMKAKMYVAKKYWKEQIGRLAKCRQYWCSRQMEMQKHIYMEVARLMPSTCFYGFGQTGAIGASTCMSQRAMLRNEWKRKFLKMKISTKLKWKNWWRDSCCYHTGADTYNISCHKKLSYIRLDQRLDYIR